MIRLLSVFVLTVSATATVLAADDAFVGKWKLDTSKSKMTGLQEKIEHLDGDSYKFSFGDNVETLVFDGKPHPDKYGDVETITSEGADKWKEVIMRDGKTIATAAWTVSDGGQTFTSVSEHFRADGSKDSSCFKAKRIAGTSGLAGTWESTELQLGAPSLMEIEPLGEDGLSFNTPKSKEHDGVKFDGKDYPNEGPRVAPGSTTSGKRIDAKTIELTDKLKDKVTDLQKMELSEDGKTLTVTFTFPGVEKAETDVFTRE